ncbi:hypothetical protein KM043_005024 [Ampulex compressa]|nr:hypothetical protein KM043_005024 [Ampulex compressa]
MNAKLLVLVLAIVSCMLLCAAEKSGVAGTGCVGALTTGRCRAAMRRFGYDHKQGKCVEFLYGGCDPTPNNFRTLEQCAKRCESKNEQ